MDFDIRPADWESFRAVMGDKGGCGGCWCMLWRLPKKQMDAQMGEDNRLAMKALFESGQISGLIAFVEDNPVGWIHLDDRSAFTRLASSRVLKPVDDKPVWSVACFLIDKRHRRKGLSARLLLGACDLARERGAQILEGYPIDTPKTRYPPVYAWTGFAGAFRRAGFSEVARRSPTRPIMRRVL